jgi:hypothetical protein
MLITDSLCSLAESFQTVIVALKPFHVTESVVPLLSQRPRQLLQAFICWLQVFNGWRLLEHLATKTPIGTPRRLRAMLELPDVLLHLRVEAFYSHPHTRAHPVVAEIDGGYTRRRPEFHGLGEKK